MISLLKYLRKKEWVLIVISIALIFFQVFLDLKMPDYTKNLSTMLSSGNITVKDSLVNGGYMMLCALGSIATSIIVGFIAARVGAGFSYALRDNIFDKVQSFSNEEINKFQTSSLITRSTNDVVQVQTFITLGLQVLVKAPIMAIWAIFKISNTSIEWTLTIGVGVGLLAILVIILVITCLPRFRKIQKLTDRLNEVSRENISGVRVIKAFNAEGYQERKFEKANDDITKNNLFTAKGMALMMPFMNMIMSLMSLAIYWLGAYIISRQVTIEDKFAQIGNMTAFLQYSMQIVMSFMLLIMIFIILPRCLVSANRIKEVLDSNSKIKNGNYKLLTEDRGVVEFKNVSFKYPDAQNDVLHNLSFKINHGETLAIIGKTGSGKSTIIDLIERFYDVSEGEILIDNVNIKDYELSALHKKIGLITQKVTLFNKSIKENVGYFENDNSEIDENRVIESLKDAHAYDFVNSLEDKLDTIVSQGGTNFSGGQKQRLSIARALYAHPEIIMFDDSFSALDYKTDKELRQTIKEKYSGITNIIISQRIGTIKSANQIIVIDDGNIVGIGKHRDLYKNCTLYKDIALSQLSEEEILCQDQ